MAESITSGVAEKNFSFLVSTKLAPLMAAFSTPEGLTRLYG